MTNIAATPNVTISTTDIKARNGEARKIEAAFVKTEKGEKVPNLSAYRDQLARLEKVAGITHAALNKTGMQVNPELTAIRKAHDDHRQLLSRISSMAKSAGIASANPVNPKASGPARQPASSAAPAKTAPNPFAGLSPQDLPSWEGKLRKGETPLHWAVRNHHHQLALILVASGHPLEIPDSRKLTPVDEAFLQNDRQMIDCLLYPDTILDPKAGAEFWKRVDAVKGKFTAMQNVDPNKVSSTAWAAYMGDVEKLKAANDVDIADSTGLTALHYAILGGNMNAIAYLLGRCNIYATTKAKHSYLDYAIIAGNTPLYNLLQAKLSFTLCPDAEKREHLIASGIIENLLQRRAQARDPLAMGGSDQAFSGINVNAAWAASKLFNTWWGKTATPGWMEWAGSKTENCFYALNEIYGHRPALNLLPNWARKAVQYYYIGALITAYPLSMLNNFLPPAMQLRWGLVKTLIGDLGERNLAMATNVAGVAWTGLRFCGAVKPVLDRIPAYIDSFKSRPVQIMKKVGMDLFNVASQGFMTYYSYYPTL